MLSNSLALEYYHPQSDRWTITKCRLTQVWPKRRIADTQLPKYLALELAVNLIQAESFKVTQDEWLADGKRIITLEQDRDALLAKQKIEVELRERVQLEALEQEHLRKLNLSRQMRLEQKQSTSIAGLKSPKYYDNPNGYEAALEGILDYREDRSWARKMYVNPQRLYTL